MQILFAIGLVLLAASLRIWLLQILGTRVPYATFLPAVMLAAVSGGFYIGIFATLLSSLCVYFWTLFY